MNKTLAALPAETVKSTTSLRTSVRNASIMQQYDIDDSRVKTVTIQWYISINEV